MSVTRFEDLPNELLQEIFSLLSPKEVLVGFSHLNERLTDVIFSSQYTLALRDEEAANLFRIAALFCRQVRCLVIKFRWTHIIPHCPNVRKFYKYGEVSWNVFFQTNDSFYARQLTMFKITLLLDIPSIVCERLRAVHVDHCNEAQLMAI